MRRLFLICLLFISVDSYSQVDADSFARAVQQRTDSLNAAIHRNDSITNEIRMKEDAKRNAETLNNFMNEKKKRDARQKRDAMIRIGIGVLFFAVLIIGIIRRRKKAGSR
jgi:hypothetical protein